MFFDAYSFSDKQLFEADVCIVGAGAAGISIAKEFISTDIKVIFLESGGFDFEHRTQFLYQGESVNRNFLSLEFTRRRQFGGSTATWFGRCYPLDEKDFEARSWLPYSGWPISAGDLHPFYEKANHLFELGNYNYNEENLIHGYELDLKKFHFSPPTRFGEKYRSELSQAKNIHVFLHANAVHIQLDENGERVNKIDCLTLQKKKFSVKSKTFILALGALETTRLLMASNDVQQNGIGNHYDILGRFFMEHISLFDAALESVPSDAPKDLFKLNYSFPQQNLGIVLAVGLSNEFREKNNLLNACGFFVKRPAYKVDDLFFTKQFQDFIQISNILNHTMLPNLKSIKSFLKAVYNSPSFIQAIRKKFTQLPNTSYGLQLQMESIPNPESRLTLSNKKDILGMPRLKLDWKLSRQDLDSYFRFRVSLHDELTKAGFKMRLIQHEVDEEGWPVSIVPSKHPMGTTRMHHDNKKGVVDEHCRIHNISNLYIASSSVFPTSGMANPTLTIVALALRIAENIKQGLRGFRG
jgi:choline dehydrogenase-like flavoprotein